VVALPWVSLYCLTCWNYWFIITPHSFARITSKGYWLRCQSRGSEFVSMLYRPNFCCNCGEKIERASWSIFTSRRFCGICETQYKGIDYLPRVVVVIAGIIMVTGVAGLLRSGPPPPSSGLDASSRQRRVAAPPVTKADESPASQRVAGTNQTQNGSVQPAPLSPPAANSLQRRAAQKTSTETVHYCGALTKKGTACTRRVKSNGRCWQHQGQPSAAEFR
jgi:hypothetical protein